MKKTFFLAALLVLSISLYAQVGNNSFTTASWKLLDNAQRAYDQGDIMMAIKLAENARQARSEEFTNAATTMENALIPTAVQRQGDLIPDIRKIWGERKESQALAVLDDALLLHTEEDFKNSITEVCKWYRSRISYPEAEYLLAKLYMLEGEYSVAADFFEQSIQHSDVLDVQDEKISILYDYAYLDELRNNSDGYERNLLEIINYNDGKKTEQESVSAQNYINAIIRATSTRTRSIDNFFLLYRMYDYDIISACIELASYYSENSREKDAFQYSSIAVLTSFTRIYEIITNRNVKYVFNVDSSGTSRYAALEGFLEEALKYADVQKWMKDNKVWNSFYVFGKLLLEYRGNSQMANDIFNVLYEISPDSYVKNAAATMLKQHTVMNQ